MKKTRVILIVISICYISCNKKLKKNPQVEVNPIVKTSSIVKKDSILIGRTIKNDSLIDLSSISKLKEFENTEIKIRKRDTITLKPYELIYGKISDKTSQKHQGSGIIIVDSKKSNDRIFWHYFDPSDFPPHTFNFIDFNGDKKKDLYMYSGFEDVFNSSLFINQLDNNSIQTFTKVYNNDYSYCSIIDINNDNIPEIINTISRFGDEDASLFIEIDKDTKTKINEEYDRIIGVFDKYNFNYNMPTAYKKISINILDEINILRIDNDNNIVDVTSDYQEHLEFRIDALKSIKNVSDEFEIWIDKLITKYKQLFTTLYIANWAV